MRVSRKAREESHARIVQEAARLVRQRGIEATSVGDIMQAAGLTHGGFYRHFDSKEALVAQASRSAFQAMADNIDQRAESTGLKRAVDIYVENYLSAFHVKTPEAGCPMAALGIEAGRGSPDIQAALLQGAEQIIDRMVRANGTDTAAGRAAALRQLSLMLGGVIIARAVRGQDLVNEVLDACRAVRLDQPGSPSALG